MIVADLVGVIRHREEVDRGQHTPLVARPQASQEHTRRLDVTVGQVAQPGVNRGGQAKRHLHAAALANSLRSSRT